jgi:hypothetical protein
MCYSGRCMWEDYMGDCNFPLCIKEVRDKYPHRLCGIDIQCEEEQELLEEKNQEVLEIVKKHRNATQR